MCPKPCRHVASFLKRERGQTDQKTDKRVIKNVNFVIFPYFFLNAQKKWGGGAVFSQVNILYVEEAGWFINLQLTVRSTENFKI